MFIFTTINNRIKYYLYKNSTIKSNNNKIQYCTIPYIKNFSNKMASSFSKYNLKIAYRCNNELDTFIKTNKDPLLYTQKCQVVYKISCNDCNATYVGQTKRQLIIRIKEKDKILIKKQTSNFRTPFKYRSQF